MFASAQNFQTDDALWRLYDYAPGIGRERLVGGKIDILT